MLRSLFVKLSLLLSLLIPTATVLAAPDITDDLNARLFFALIEGDDDTIARLIKNGANIEQRDNQGATPLITASRLGHLTIVKTLLRHKADVNAVDTAFNDTALKWASYNGHKKVVELLLSSKANVQLRDKEGNTAIIDAARKGHDAIVALLIKHGSKVDDQNYKGETAFSVAKRQGLTKVMDVLRKHNADEELGESDNGNAVQELLVKLNDSAIPKPVKKELRRTILENAADTKTYLDLVFSLPWGKETTDTFDIKNARAILDADHFGMKEVKEQILDYIATLNFKKDGKAPILCLVGPPGIGKTSLGKSIAKALGRKYTRIAVGGLHDESELRGHRRTYIGARPGRIIQAYKQAESMNPVFLIDEIDKMGMRNHHGDPYAAMLEILDPEQNSTFRDNYLEIPFDLSRTLFIATANDLDSIPGPLRDRMEIIHLSSYSPQEKIAIIEKHLLEQAIKDAGLDSKKIQISPEVLKKLVESYSQGEPGMRQVKRNLAKLMAKIARGLIENKKVISINPKNLEEHLGPAMNSGDDLDANNRIGVTNGLYWSAAGGGVIKVETALVPRTQFESPLKLTGQLQTMAQESAETALSYIRAHARELGIDDAIFAENAIHINWANKHYSPSDGPSAGAAMIAAMVSLLTNRPIKADFAMTGAINLRGNVNLIGGLKEKILGAKRLGIKHVLVPYDNKKDIEKLDKFVTAGIEIILVKHVDEVLQQVLM